MNTKSEILKKLNEIKPILQREYSVKNIGLFGSFADETFNAESDIDLLVELERPIGWKLLTLEIFLEKVFSRKIDLVTKNALKAPLNKFILNQVQYI
ncbi:MAG: nucleotidyltransferase family protein [Ignavibacteriales bacterium]|nr:MAG: nucleotidyltransferase family protein [Ignavibacteriales bacterium]